MERSLDRAFTRMERERKAFLDSVSHIPEDLLEQSPATGKWSIAQIVVHLVQAETSALSYLRKKLHHGGHGPVRLAGTFRLVALRCALATPVRWKAPRIISDVPHINWQDATMQWRSVRDDWRRSLEDLPPGTAAHGLFKHPVAGKLTLAQGLRFMATHVRHHHGQAMRHAGQLPGGGWRKVGSGPS